MSCVVVFITTYMLILPALTLEKDKAADQGGIDVPEVNVVNSDEEEAAPSFEEQKSEDDGFNDTAGSSSSKQSDKITQSIETNVVSPEPSEKEVLQFEGEGFSVSVGDKSAVLPDDTKLVVDELLEKPVEGTKAERREKSEAYKDYCDQAIRAINDDSKSKTAKVISFVKLYDISLQSSGNEITPDKPVNVTISYDQDISKNLKVDNKADLHIIHFAQNEKTGEITTEILDKKDVDITLNKSRMTETSFETDSFSVYAIVYTTEISTDYITSSGDEYTITVEFDEAAMIPADAELKVNEISEGSAKYKKYLKESVSELNADDNDISFARFFDIEIIDKEGKKIEPKTPVQVKIKYKDAIDLDGEKTLNIVHFADDGTEVINDISVSDDQKEIVYEQESFSVTGTIVTGNLSNNTNYALVVKQGDKYYAVLNDGTLEEVTYNSQNNTITTNHPVTWQYKIVNGGFNLRMPVSGLHFDYQQLADQFRYHLIDPTKDKGYDVKDQQSPNGAIPESTALHRDGNKITANGKYISVAENADGGLRIVGNETSRDNAAEILFAEIRTVPSDSSWPHSNNVVNHIDISIEGNSTVNVPLAYGDYYDAYGNVIFTSTEADHILTMTQTVPIEENDIKNATITASAYAKNPDGTNSTEKVEVPEAFYVTGYSGNEENSASTKQIRTEGSFKVAYLEPDKQYYNPEDGRWYYGRDINDGNHPEVRLYNRVYYTLSVTKNVTFPLMKDGQQLYDHTGTALQVTIPVTLSASFDYWDKRNECPPVHQGYDPTAAFSPDWEKGIIIDQGRTESGMDFKLGTAYSEDNAEVLAVEIVKYIVDEDGNRIHPNQMFEDTFVIYENLTDDDRGVIGVGIDKDAPSDLYNGYSQLHENARGVLVGTDGVGQTYDYDINANTNTPLRGLYYIEEEQESIPETIVDTNGKEWVYKGTRIETESPWRNNAAHDEKMHVAEGLKSIPEVVGVYQDENENWTWNDNGEQKPLRNGFLEFYVYNVYESHKGDVSFIKTDSDGKPIGGGVFTLFKTYEDGILRDELWKGGHIVEATSDPVTGEVKFEDIPVGSYYMQETAAPEGKLKEDTVYLVVIEDKTDGTKESKVTYLDGTPLDNNSIENGPGKYGELTFVKKNAAGAALSGAEFTLYRTASCVSGMEVIINGEVVKATSDSAGNVTFTATQTIQDLTLVGIPVGNYYMKETGAPEGYEISNTRYFVHIAATDDENDSSFIAELETNPALNGMTLEEYYRTKAIEEVVNLKSGELQVRKQWRDYFGNTLNYNGTLDLTLVQWTKRDMTPHTVKFNILCEGNGSGNNNGQTTLLAEREGTGIGDVSISWDWNQWTDDKEIEVTGLGTSTYSTTYNPNGNYGKGGRTVTINNVTQDMTVTILIKNGGWTGTEDDKIHQPVFSGAGEDDTSPLPTGGTKKITLGASGVWTQNFSVSGDGLLSNESTTLPLTYNGKECFYTISEESVPDGFTVSYSNNNNGIQEGILTAYNRRTSVDINIIKEDKDNHQTRLDGAEFTLWQIDPENATVTHLSEDGTVVTTRDGGRASFADLATGYYEIKETHAPDGYILEDDASSYIKITNNGVYQIAKTDGQPPSGWPVADNTSVIVLRNGTITVLNQPGAALPQTGGIGTTIFYVLGSMLVLGCGIYLIARRRIA